MKILTNIGKLLGVAENPAFKQGNQMADVGEIRHAWLLIDQGRIIDYGPMTDLPDLPVEQISAEGALVTPSMVDCHTHLVFAASREDEFVDRIRGLSYQEIAERGGGILNSVRKLRAMSEDELFDRALKRQNMAMLSGTGAIEIKSGYGLNTDSELRMLRVIRRLREASGIPVKASFLGAHAVAPEFVGRQEHYVDHLIREMLPEVAAGGLADFVDVFCEEGYFAVEQTRRICEKALELGLPLRLHVNQFRSIGGLQMAASLGAVSVEHLEVLSEDDYFTLQNSKLIPVSLPACSFFLGLPYTPLKELLNRGVGFALASDFNPGSSPVYDLHFVFALACIQQKVLPEVAFNALTVNPACTLGLEKEVGSITRGARANLNFYPPGQLSQIPYYPGARLIERVMINGDFLERQ